MQDDFEKIRGELLFGEGAQQAQKNQDAANRARAEGKPELEVRWLQEGAKSPQERQAVRNAYAKEIQRTNFGGNQIPPISHAIADRVVDTHFVTGLDDGREAAAVTLAAQAANEQSLLASLNALRHLDNPLSDEGNTRALERIAEARVKAYLDEQGIDFSKVNMKAIATEGVHFARDPDAHQPKSRGGRE